MTDKITKGCYYVCDTDSLNFFTKGNVYVSTSFDELVADNDESIYITKTVMGHFTQVDSDNDHIGNVEHPSHYNKNGIECFDVIRAFIGEDGFDAFCLGNAIKYIVRCKWKGNYTEDIKKARFYLDELLQHSPINDGNVE